MVACQDKADIRDRMEKGSYEQARLSPEQKGILKTWIETMQRPQLRPRRNEDILDILVQDRVELPHIVPIQQKKKAGLAGHQQQMGVGRRAQGIGQNHRRG